MFKKAGVSILLTVVLLLSFTGTGYASAAASIPDESSSDGGYSVYMTYIFSMECNLWISPYGLTESNAEIWAYSGVDSVRISLYLQQYSGGTWNTVKHWAQDYEGDYGSMTKYWYVMSGYEYRIFVYYYAYDGDQTESYYQIFDDVWY